MKYLLTCLILLPSLAFGNSVTLNKNQQSPTTVAVHSASIIKYGVSIMTNNNQVCLVDSDFLKSNNISGLDLMKALNDRSSNLVIDCQFVEMIRYKATAINPR